MRKWFSSLSLLLSLAGCAGAPVPDVPIGRPLEEILVKRKDAFGIVVTDVRPNPECMKVIKEPKCGFYQWTATNKSQYVGEAPKTWLYGKPWSKLQPEALTLPSESMAEIKGAFMNICKKYGCSQSDIAKWRIKLDSFDSIGDLITKP